MDIELLTYLQRIRNHDIGLLEVSAPFLASFALAWLLTRMRRSPLRLGRVAVLVSSLAGGLVGLTLTTVVLPCPWCTPETRGCQVQSVGVPFPQLFREIDPPGGPPGGWTDVCVMSWGQSRVSTAANFAIGVVAVPFLLSLVRRRIHRGGTLQRTQE